MTRPTGTTPLLPIGVAVTLGLLAFPAALLGQSDEALRGIPMAAPPGFASQDTRGAAEAAPLAVLFADADGDGRFDREGQYVSAIGVLTSGITDGRGVQMVRLQDGTRGGVVIMRSRASLIDRFQPDDLVQVWGRIQGAGGLPLINSDSIRVVGKAPPVAPSDVMIVALHEGGRTGMKVRVSGRLVATPDGPEDAALTDETGRIDIRFQDAFEPTYELLEAMAEGRIATVIGFPMPAGTGARLSVDRVEDIVIRPVPRYALAGALGGGIVVLVVGVGLLAKHKATVRRNREQEGLIATLKDTRDVLEQSRFEVSQSETRYRSLVDNAPFGLFLTDGRGAIEDANPALVEMLAYLSKEDLVGLPIGELLHSGPDTWAEFAGAMLTGVEGPREATWRTKGGDTMRVLVGLRLVPGRADGRTLVEGYVENVDDRQRLEDQLRQAQKMEAVGRLAGGVAHDFNNLLTVVLASADFLLMDLPESEKLEEVERIRVAANGAAALTQQLLAFSRKQPLQLRVLHVNDVVKESMSLIKRLVEENVEVVSAIDLEAGSVEVDPGQLQQVIMNLVVNARDAMPGGGRLTIRTESVQIADAGPPGTDIVSGDYVVVSVSDTGTGMTEETKRHLFEPFFTTKELGRGTGLGLATVYGIIKQSRGYVYADSTEGVGTTFTIYLPRTRASAFFEQGVEVGRPGDTAGQGTILLVEDQPDVRSLVRRTLRRSGFHTIEACDGRDALRVLDGHEGPIAALVTDVVMPNMSGRELAEELNVRRPGTKVLFMSGYTDDVVFAEGAFENHEAFVRKPFTMNALVQSVRTLLGGAAGGRGAAA